MLIARWGQTTLAMVFVIGTIVIFAGLTIAFLVVSFINASAGFQGSARALSLAAAGSADAMMQLTRNKEFSSSGGYSVPVDTYTATVTVVQNSPGTGQATITATGVVSIYTRRIQAIVSVATSTGQVDLLTWKLL